METKKIHLRLMTPLWTGDVDGECNELRETGLVGSIRWWFRLFLRVHGISCNRESRFDQSIYVESIKKYSKKLLVDSSDDAFLKRVQFQLQALSCSCPDCLIFGTTGWKKQIGLRVSNPPKAKKLRFPSKIYQRGWNKGTQVVYGDLQNRLYLPITLEIIPHTIDGERYYKILSYILTQVSNYGALGSKTQNGFGVFKIHNYPEMKATINEGKKLLEYVIKESQKLQQGNHDKFPQRFFSYNFTFKEPNLEYFRKTILEDQGKELIWKKFSPYNNTARIVKAKIRSEYNKNTADKLFGVGGNSPRASRINISGIYKIKRDLYGMRVWGEEPDNVDNFAEEKLLKQIAMLFGRNSKHVRYIDNKPNFIGKEWGDKD